MPKRSGPVSTKRRKSAGSVKARASNAASPPAFLLVGTAPAFPPDLIVAAPRQANTAPRSKTAPRKSRTARNERPAVETLPPPPATAATRPRRRPSAPPRPASPAAVRDLPAAPAPLPRNRSLTQRRGGGLFSIVAEVLRFAGLSSGSQAQPKAAPRRAPAHAEMARLRAENAALRRELEALIALREGNPLVAVTG